MHTHSQKYERAEFGPAFSPPEWGPTCLTTNRKMQCTQWLVTLSVLGVIADKFALLRGQRTGLTFGDGRRPIPSYLDKIFKFSILLLVYVYPLCALVSPWLLIPCLLYAPSYLDGSENGEGRSNNYYRNLSLWAWFKARLNLKLVVVKRLDPQKQVKCPSDFFVQRHVVESAKLDSCSIFWLLTHTAFFPWEQQSIS
jgi:hypothetical protein